MLDAEYILIECGFFKVKYLTSNETNIIYV